MQQDPNRRIVQLLPGNGWNIWRYTDKPIASPLIGWALLANGEVVPLDSDTNGIVDDARGGNTVAILPVGYQVDQGMIDAWKESYGTRALPTRQAG